MKPAFASLLVALFAVALRAAPSTGDVFTNYGGELGVVYEPPVESFAANSEVSSRRAGTVATPKDSWVRSVGCLDPKGNPCVMCCNNTCCEAHVVNTTAARSSSTRPFEHDHQLWVPLRFVIIAYEANETLPVNQSDLLYQMEVTNRLFEDANIRFFIDSQTVFKNDTMAASCDLRQCFKRVGNYSYVIPCHWYNLTLPTVRSEGTDVVDVIICDTFSWGLGGHTYLPWQTPEATTLTDFIQVTPQTIGNVSAGKSYGGGITLTHELGHYFGLHHVFGMVPSCGGMNDWIADTGATNGTAWDPANPSICKNDTKSCGEVEPWDNIMNYGPNHCRTRFTPGQVDFMQRATGLYRPQFYQSHYVAGYCPVAATELSQCRCVDASKAATSYCVNAAATSGAASLTAAGAGLLVVVLSLLTVL